MGLKWLTPNEYNQKTGLGVEEIKKQCHLGKLEHLITDGGYYKVAYYEGDGSDKELLKENAELKQKLKMIMSIIGG